jgi:Ca2+-transporting ATPase
MPFSSSRKRMSTVILDEQGVNIYVKGASEIVLDSCSQIQGFNGKLDKIDSGKRAEIEDAIAKMANQALRTIIIAQKQVKNESIPTQIN